MKHTEHNSFFNEANETIKRIQNENPSLNELNWFCSAACARFNRDYLSSRDPQVIVLGGSLETAHWADELPPRDTDPFSRSSIGWLINPEFDLVV